jgi:hypothetical protein
MTTGEAEDASIKVIHTEIAAFSTEYWDLQCTTNRFALSSDRAPAMEIIRDLTVGIFTLLAYTPVQAVGLNRAEHWEMESESALDSLGDRLVPRDNWKSLLMKPGMRTLTVQGERPDERDGYIWVRVEPSAEIGHGVFIDINDHYGLPSATEEESAETIDSARRLVELISTEWSRSRERAQEIIGGLING